MSELFRDFRSGEVEAGRALLASMEEMARRQGAEFLSGLCPQSGASAETLRSALYWRVPEVLHPQKMCLSVRGLGKCSDCPELVDPRVWHVSWADMDVV